MLTLRHILQREGWTGLYDGLGSDTLATVLSKYVHSHSYSPHSDLFPYSFLYFYFYSFLRTLMVRRKMRLSTARATKGRSVPIMLSVSEELGIGVFAGVASRAISMPLNLITVRLQTETEGEDEPRGMNAAKDRSGEAKSNCPSSGVISTLHKIYDEEGLRGFWRGQHVADY